jgi:hypothetical protein
MDEVIGKKKEKEKKEKKDKKVPSSKVRAPMMFD